MILRQVAAVGVMLACPASIKGFWASQNDPLRRMLRLVFYIFARIQKCPSFWFCKASFLGVILSYLKLGLFCLVYVLSGCVTKSPTQPDAVVEQKKRQLFYSYVAAKMFADAAALLPQKLDNYDAKESFEWLLAKAHYHSEKLNFPQARRIYLGLLQSSPQSLRLQNNYGVFVAQAESKDEAQKLFEKLILQIENSDEEYPHAYFNYAKLLEQAGNWQKAKIMFEKSAQISTDYAEVYLYLSEQEALRHNYPASKQYQDSYLKIVP